MEDIWAVRFVVLIQSQAWSRSREHAGERGLTHVQRVAPQVVAVKFDQVEGPHEHVCVVVPVPDTIEGCDPIVTARHGLPVDDTGLRAQLGQRLDYEGKAVAQIAPRSAVEPHPLACLACDDPEAVMLDFVQPRLAGWWGRGIGGKAWRNE